MNKKTKITLLKILVALLVFGGLIIGTLAMSPGEFVNEKHQEVLHQTYLLYESLGRGLMIVFGGLIVFSMIKKKHKNKEGLGLRQKAIIGFIISASLLLIILPLTTGFLEYVNVMMPFPWSTLPLQLLYDGHYFSSDYSAAFSGNGTIVLCIAYLIFNVLTFIGVAFLGRRFFCSTLCVNFGGHAETLKEGLPLFETKRSKAIKNSPYYVNVMNGFKWTFLVLNILLIMLWSLLLIFDIQIINVTAMRYIELIKYMVFELLMVLFAFSAISGRFYCMYCPAGAFISLTGRIAGQKIITDKAECISCGQCNKACAMKIDIMTCAQSKVPLNHLNCVGCGACVDVCPVNTLEYTTNYLKKQNAK